MKFSELFIRRPVATTLLTMAITVAGIMAYLNLPVAPLPQIDFPSINVNAGMPGANPDTMSTTVATPLERALGRIPGITEMTSTSREGSTNVNLQFELDRDINAVANEVQAAINAAMPSLPSGMPSPPSYWKANPADAPIMILSLRSEIHSQGELYDMASTQLVQKISRLSGISQVQVVGSTAPAIRISLDGSKLQAAGLTMDQVRNTITNNNINRPTGWINSEQKSWMVTANDQLNTSQDFSEIVVRYKDGSLLRLADLGEVKDSVQDQNSYGTNNGKPSISMILFRQPGANLLETCDQVRDMLPQLQAMLPPTTHLTVVMERTVSIRGSLAEVKHSLIIAVILVVLVVLLFLRRVKAALVPGVAVPVSLLGTFIVMWIFGFTIDNLSLMALTVATGFVVDDAVVVLENITRRMEEGMSAMEASIKGASEVTSTVISMSLSLIAVFIPILYMGGVTGRFFREFAIVLSASIMVSLVVSLTTTPMMCARLLKHTEGEKEPGIVSRSIERFFDFIVSLYSRSLKVALNHSWVTMFALLACVALSVDLYKRSPKGFFPEQDTGQIRGNISGDQTISFNAMKEKVIQAAEIIQKDPSVENVNVGAGAGNWGASRNNGSFMITLKPYEQRKGETTKDVIERLRKATANIVGTGVFFQPTRDIRIGGRDSDSSIQYTVKSNDLVLLRAAQKKINAALREIKLITQVNSDFQDRGSLTQLTVDREKASRLGVSMNAITAALYNSFGQRQISTIYETLNQYRVVLEIIEPQRQDATSLELIELTGANGKKVPLTELATWEMGATPLSVNHDGQMAAITFSFELAEGVSMSDASAAVEQAVADLKLPQEVETGFAGSASAFQKTVNNQPLLILAAIVVIYLTLGILYESFIHPITILSTLPSAGVGALLALRLKEMDFDIIGFIGIFLLIGIVKKNAIMMIDFALDAMRREGKSPREAITEACEKRFRPILMTTLAALLGALPLAIGNGQGAEIRRPLGVAIVGGLIFSQLITLYTTPVIYLLLDRLSTRAKSALRRFQSGAPSSEASPEASSHVPS
jgi:multidrug efflux pump